MLRQRPIEDILADEPFGEQRFVGANALAARRRSGELQHLLRHAMRRKKGDFDGNGSRRGRTRRRRPANGRGVSERPASERLRRKFVLDLRSRGSNTIDRHKIHAINPASASSLRATIDLQQGPSNPFMRRLPQPRRTRLLASIRAALAALFLTSSFAAAAADGAPPAPAPPRRRRRPRMRPHSGTPTARRKSRTSPDCARSAS